MFPAKTKSPLAAAEKAAQTYSDSQPLGATTMPCPNAQKELKEVIKVKVVGEDGVGLGGIALQLSRDDKQILTGKTAPDGMYAFKGLEPGSYQLILPELDQDAWKELETQPLPEDEAKSSSVASWQSPSSSPEAIDKIHVIKQGECVGKIAEVYGFFPKTIWDYGKNAELRELRHDEMYILFPEDKVVIPVKRQKAQVVATGDELTVQRQGVPERLRIRFLANGGSPRIGVPYLLSIVTTALVSVPDISSETDAGGYVNQSVPPSAKFACITLNPDSEGDKYEFDVGHIDPVDKESGWQARLSNLGYGSKNAESTNLNINAISVFQSRSNLELTGEINEETINSLKQKYGA